MVWTWCRCSFLSLNFITINGDIVEQLIVFSLQISGNLAWWCTVSYTPYQISAQHVSKCLNYRHFFTFSSEAILDFGLGFNMLVLLLSYLNKFEIKLQVIYVPITLKSRGNHCWPTIYLAVKLDISKLHCCRVRAWRRRWPQNEE